MFEIADLYFFLLGCVPKLIFAGIFLVGLYFVVKWAIKKALQEHFGQGK